MKSEIGIIGMGVMGKSLAINLSKKNVAVSIYNRHLEGKEEGVAKQVADENQNLQLTPFDSLQPFILSIQKPRRIIAMISSAALDDLLFDIVPLLDAGDVIVDGGNSHYLDTERRIEDCNKQQIIFVGAGISGGEAGALNGPAIMPGGPPDGYKLLHPYFDLLAAKDKDGNPCSVYIGNGGAGHFVKMVHNGIEYAEMQAIAEIYHLLRSVLSRTPEEIASILSQWKQKGCSSYLLDITIEIITKYEGSELLLDKILDKAENKGTGSWSATTAIEMGVPYSSLTEAVMARYISSYKSRRNQLHAVYQQEHTNAPSFTEDDLRRTLEFTRIINHEIGFDLLYKTSEKKKWNLNLKEIARIWSNGCIIKSGLIEDIWMQLDEHSLLSTPIFIEIIKSSLSASTAVISSAMKHGIATPVLSSAMNYYLGMTTANSPANLIQAMRDYFGAHTYQRIDQPGEKYFHTKW